MWKERGQTKRDKLVLQEWGFCRWVGNPPKENKVLISKDAQPWKRCSNYRGISLLNSGYKIYTKIIAQCFKTISEAILLEEQNGSRIGRSRIDKVFTIKPLTKNTNATDLHIPYGTRQSSSIHSTKFWGLVIDNNLSWHCHIDQMIQKLNKASYIIRSLKPSLPLSH